MLNYLRYIGHRLLFVVYNGPLSNIKEPTPEKRVIMRGVVFRFSNCVALLDETKNNAFNRKMKNREFESSTDILKSIVFMS